MFNNFKSYMVASFKYQEIKFKHASWQKKIHYLKASTFFLQGMCVCVWCTQHSFYLITSDKKKRQ